jgi:cytochrome P450
MSLHAIPEVPGATRFGHVGLFQSERLRFLLSARQTGDLARLRFMHKAFLVSSGPRSAHEVLVEKAKHFEKSPGLRFLLYYLAGDGLFTSEGELWRRQRRLMAPLFQPSQIARYAKVMVDTTLRAIGDWRDGARIDVARETTRIAMGVVGKALFDSDTFDEADELGEALTTALQWTNDRSASPTIIPQIYLADVAQDVGAFVPERFRAWHTRIEERLKEPFMLPGARSPALRGAIQRLDRRVQQMIDERRAQGLSRDDLLTRLLAARDDEGSGERMSDKQVRDEAVTLFVAGHETTATSLAWAVYLLARNPEIYDRVQAEVDALEGEPTFETVAKLSLTLRVFKESMRLYPPVLILGRRTIDEVEIAGRRLPPRTILFVNVYGVHRDPEAWPDPERFEPDRFLSECESRRHRTAYLPFGAGPRVCVGNHFALLEGPLVLATLLRRVRFERNPAEVIEPDLFATLRPAGGVPATVRFRGATA